jgi:endonuclease/exonuclease/phosphatase family metal-dependent hydrolase
MPPFPEPKFKFAFDVKDELAALRKYRDTEPGRQIPTRRAGNLLLATWNIANLGVQQRTADDYRLIAEIISWFDLITVQEVNSNLAGIIAIRDHLPQNYRLLFSDASGNRERQAFLYDSTRVSQLEEIGRLSIPPAKLGQIKLPGTTTTFKGFDRGPYLGTFQAGKFRLMLASVHLFYGSNKPADLERRSLETYALAWWAQKYHLDKSTYVPDLVPLGDFNLPKAVFGDPIYKALTSRGLTVPPHSSQIASSIATDNQYDQIAFFPGESNRRFTGQMSVFDFDGALFRVLFQQRGRTDFLAWMRFHLSDHRPLWAEFRTT